MLAKRTGVPVVPAGIVGTHRKMPRGSALPKFAPVSIVYGKPFTYAEVATGANERENREIFCRELERRIIELCAAQGLTLKTSEKS